MKTPDEQLAEERNGISKVPSDPEQRRKWAHDLAVKTGWLIEPESDDKDEEVVF